MPDHADQGGGEPVRTFGSYKDLFYWTWGERGYEPAEIDAKWADFQRCHPETKRGANK